MVLAVGDARHSAGWLLPLLCLRRPVRDRAYRRHAHAPACSASALGAGRHRARGAHARGARAHLRLLVAGIVIVMIALRWLRGALRRPARRHAARARAIAGGRRRLRRLRRVRDRRSPTRPVR
jgi:hypothetical protein